MAVLLESANDEYLYRTATVPPFRSCTITGWVRYAGGQYNGVVGLLAGTTDRYGIELYETAVAAGLTGGWSDTEIKTPLPSVNDWCFFVLIHKSSTYRTSADFTVGSEIVSLHSYDEDYWAHTEYVRMHLGHQKHLDEVATRTWNGAIADVKVWGVALSQAEVEAEQFTKAPVKTADLWAYYPLDVHTDLTDHGATYGAAGGRDLTASGTLSTEASDPPWASGAPYSLSAAGGSFAWGVVAAALLRGFVLQAEATHPTGTHYTATLEPAAYTLTGEASTSWVDYSIGADGDTLALTGGAAALGNVKRLVSDAGSYTLTGEAAALSTTNILAATGASVTYTGGTAGTHLGRLVTAAGTTYEETASAATINKGATIQADSGAFLEVGQQMEMVFSVETLNLDERSFMWVG